MATKAGKKAKKPATKKVTKKVVAKTTGKNTRSVVEEKRKEALRAMLLKKKAQILKEVEEHLGQRINEALLRKIDSALDDGDLSVLDLGEDVDYALVEMRNKMRKSIDAALRGLDMDTYGTCQECGEEISEKRLKVQPFAMYCLSCQEKKEELEKIEREEAREEIM